MIAHKGILDPTSSNLRTFSMRQGWLYVHVMSSIPVQAPFQLYDLQVHATDPRAR